MGNSENCGTQVTIGFNTKKLSNDLDDMRIPKFKKPPNVAVLSLQDVLNHLLAGIQNQDTIDSIPYAIKTFGE